VKIGSKILGLAIGQKSILLAEVAPKGGRSAVQHFAEYPYPEGVSLATPEKLGEGLGAFLKSQKFTTREVVIGLPAKRLVTRQKDVPPAAPHVAASALRLQAEGEFSAELANLVMDYAGTTSTTEPTKVLLVATNRSVIDQCEAMARVAGLRVLGITATSAALGRATSRLPGGDGWILNFGPNGAEIVVQHGKDPAHLRHLNVGGGMTPEAINALAGEIRRAMATIPRNGTPSTLAVWGPATNGDVNPGSILEQRLNMPVNTPELQKLVSTESREANGFAPAVAVALSAIEPAGLPVDFLHSRLAPPAPPKVSNTKKFGILAGILALAGIAMAYYHLDQQKARLTQITRTLETQKEAVRVAQAEKDQLTEAQSRITMGPNFVKVMAAVTQLFPPGSNTIWVKRFEHRRDVSTATPAAPSTAAPAGAGTPAKAPTTAPAKKKARSEWTVEGLARDRSYATQLQQSMASDPKKRFKNVRLNYIRQESSGERLWTYSIQFIFESE
jgi:hypothetical protein